MSMQNRNVKAVLARSPVPVSAISPQVYNVKDGLMTPIKQVGFATQTGMPSAVFSINGDTAGAQNIVSGGGVTIMTKDGTTTISVP